MVKVHHLNCLEIQSPGNGRAIGHCLLLETKSRLILIDAGIGLLDTKNPDGRIGRNLINAVGFQFNEKRTALSQIKDLGLNPEKVTDCVVSHLDPDHIGGLADFPNATVHVGLEEYEHFQRGSHRYLQHQLDHRPRIKTYASTSETWRGLEARRITIVSETDIYLIPLFGHTVGHCGVALKYKANWLFYVGDAYYLRAELSDREHPVHALAEMRADDPQMRMESLNIIRRFVINNPQTKVFSYHDLSEFTPFVSDGTSKIHYRTDLKPDIKEVIELYQSSGIKRPVDDAARLANMYAHANLVITAWAGNTLVGIARALTDFCYCCYLSDLAVRRSYQRSGIGQELISLTRERIGNQTTLILLSAPEAVDYYPKMGFEKIDNGFMIRRSK